ncbi:MAG: DUF3332 family protein [Planctomycetota bacterium]|nr:DUF3332 domain-containing protein [Planctomycetota bacterium]MDB4559389.1 DUF3332 domain-containing protein [Planctomycetota bacterium]MDG1491922.1 DUF3332 family protein [Planctomycetota bacterium]
MKKIIAAAALTLGATGCLGPNNAANSLLNWNAEVSDHDAVNEAVFIGMNIIPVYPIAYMVDVVVLNTIEYWSGGNPVDAPGPFPGFSRKGGDED